MAKPVIAPEQFIKLVNDRLPSMNGYKLGMRAFLVPEGATGLTATGYDFVPNDVGTVGTVKAACDSVLSDYDVNPHISRK